MCYNPGLVHEKPLGAPASVKLVYYQSISHYLNQWWSISRMHICISQSSQYQHFKCLLFSGLLSAGERWPAILVGWNDGDDPHIWSGADGVDIDVLSSGLLTGQWVREFTIGRAAWQVLQGLLSWYPIMWSSPCNWFEDQAPVDFIYGCLIFKWVVVTWFKDRAPG